MDIIDRIEYENGLIDKENIEKYKIVNILSIFISIIIIILIIYILYLIIKYIKNKIKNKKIS